MRAPRMVLLLGCGAGLIAQTGRDAYRQAFDVWQQAQANLERDAGAGGTALVAQADRAASAAASFAATRVAYLKSTAQEAAQRRQILQTTPVRPSADLTPPAVGAMATAELQTVTRSIARFATDKDRAIQQLRQSLERERMALAALLETIQAREKSVTATAQADMALEDARVRTAAAFGEQNTQLSQAIAQLELEGPAWAGYYDKLAQALQTANAPPPPVSVTSAAPRNESPGGIPLARYVGSWTYPSVNGVFHGAKPDSVALEVQEKDGHVEGTLDAKFQPPPGSASASSIQFKFDGNLGATPTQKFALMTSDGSQGSIELIPGPAFNLLEVNFLTDPQANGIRTGNFILVKK